MERSRHAGWIEVYQHGELVSEWNQTKDPELWRWLDLLLREDAALYRPQPE